MRLAAVDAVASDAGLSPGQNLSDARALVPDLIVREIDHDFIAHVFADFADWHSNASPIVAAHTDISPYGDLMLDITGVDHLFGGESCMLEHLIGRLRPLGYTVMGAIADSIGAAWAAAHFSPNRVLPAGTAREALARLPVSALRITDAQVSGLNQMGLKTISQLYGRERKGLQARFGLSLLVRLDQALGFIEERLTPRVPITQYHADRRFAEPIGYMDDVLMTTRDLATRLALRLEAVSLGAQTFHLMLYRVDHKVMTLTVNAGRATRDANHIAQLFVHRSERLDGEYDAGFGIDMIRLAASSLSETSSTQIGAFETLDGAEDLDRLYDRMASRLGPMSVLRSKYVNTHIPERAVLLEPVVARTVDDPEATPDSGLQRPIRLLPGPEPIEVIAEVPHGPPMRMVWRRVSYRVAKASGPERIEAEWWRSGQNLNFLKSQPEDKPKPPPADPTRKKAQGVPKLEPHVSELQTFVPEHVVRDYYVIEDEVGRRFWVFRLGLYGAEQQPRWYLHGFFA